MKNFIFFLLLFLVVISCSGQTIDTTIHNNGRWCYFDSNEGTYVVDTTLHPHQLVKAFDMPKPQRNSISGKILHSFTIGSGDFNRTNKILDYVAQFESVDKLAKLTIVNTKGETTVYAYLSSDEEDWWYGYIKTVSVASFLWPAESPQPLLKFN